MQINLAGRTALITGGSKGLGLAMAERMAASGADVAIMARDPEGLAQASETILKTARARVEAIACNVADAASVQAGYDSVMARLGRVDILVNNAGTSRAMPIEAVTDEIWQQDLDLKLFAAIRFARLVWPQMTARRWGRVINVLNIGAKAPKAGSAPTTVSRAAGLALTKVLAGEGAPHNILVNALHVGLIVSDQWVQRHKKSGSNEPLATFLQNLAKPVPLGRLGEAEEFANLACFLASDQASYISGTSINVDGNLSPVW
jgi:NAD(P)-dependent dehydrogenase (short-subunit alcohol dehydrogenase family)